MSWIAVAGAILLGAVLLKAIVDSDAKIYRCPYCNLVIRKNAHVCPRCGQQISWGGV